MPPEKLDHNKDHAGIRLGPIEISLDGPFAKQAFTTFLLSVGIMGGGYFMGTRLYSLQAEVDQMKQQMSEFRGALVRKGILAPGLPSAQAKGREVRPQELAEKP